jgi:hypothetical protein
VFDFWQPVVRKQLQGKLDVYATMMDYVATHPWGPGAPAVAPVAADVCYKSHHSKPVGNYGSTSYSRTSGTVTRVLEFAAWRMPTIMPPGRTDNAYVPDERPSTAAVTRPGETVILPLSPGDHSKLAFFTLNGQKYMCVGDLNRDASQRNR